jgi:hypothetical protein
LQYSKVEGVEAISSLNGTEDKVVMLENERCGLTRYWKAPIPNQMFDIEEQELCPSLLLVDH